MTSIPPSTSSTAPIPDRERQTDEKWFASTPLPDLTFSFKPRPLRLTRSEDMLRDWEREGAGEGEEESEGRLRLGSQCESEREAEETETESESEMEREENVEECQIIEARTTFVESRKREEGNEGTPSDRKEERRLLKVSTGTHNSGDRSGLTNPDSFIDPLMARPLPSPTLDFPPSSPAPFLPSSIPPSPRTPTSPFPFALSSETPSPPRHDLTGRPLPSAPPPLLPFDIPSSPAPRSPRQRFSSTKSFARSLSQRRKGESREDTMQGENTLRSCWDSTMETDRTIDSVTDSPRRSRLRIPLPSPMPFPSNSNLSLPTPPARSYSPEPTSPSLYRSSYFTALPDSRTPPTRTPTSSSFQLSPRPSSPTTPTSLHPSFSISHSSIPPQRFPTPLSPSFPLPPLSIPPSASSSSFPLPPSYPQTPTSASHSHSHEDNSPLYPPPTPVPLVPKFISVFIDPSHNQSSSSFPPSATQATTTHSIRRRNPSLSANNFDVSDDEKLVDSKRRTMKWLNEVNYNSSMSNEGSSGSIGKGGRKKRDRIREGWMKRLKRFGKSKRGKWIMTIGALGVGLLVIVIGVIVGMRKEDLGECGCENGRKPSLDQGICSCSCREGWGGTRCDLDGTCVEVETVQGTERIAQGLIDLAQSTSSLWSPSIDVPRLAYTLHQYVSRYSSSPSIDCSAQLSLLDVPSLILYPTRLSFAQSALLHTLALTESNSTHFRLQHFISSLDYSQFGDSPSPTRNSNFQIISGGFTWDLASLERLVQDVQWEDLVDAGEEEMKRREGKLEGLERVTGYAVASHAQRGEALEHYWADPLGRKEEELDGFREKVRSARIVIPFEEDVRVVEERLAKRNYSLSIIEGTGCRAGLSEDMIERVNEIEDGVFGLPKIVSNGSSDCSIRPIYGFLDFLSLSSTSSSASPSQSALILTQNVTSRLTYHSPALLSLENSSSSAPTPVTIEQFGLSNQFDHVLLDYLNPLEVDRAKLVLDYALTSTTDTTTSDSQLAGMINGLEHLPLIVVQVWGGIRWDEVEELKSGT